MSCEEVVAMVTEMGLPHAYDHFAEGESPDPPPLEARIEAVLSKHELFYNKTEVWIASEGLYEVLYELEV